MRTCIKCQQTFPLERFTKTKQSKDGFGNMCKPCKVKQGQAWYQANKERKAATKRAWRERNKAKIAAQSAAYRQANADKRAAYQRDWQAANPDKVREAVLRRIARRKNATTYVITAKDLRRLMSSPCAFPGCTTGDPVELDHVIPLSRGGSHGIGNIQPLCRHHNRTKHDKTWIEYRAHVARIAA